MGIVKQSRGVFYLELKQISYGKICFVDYTDLLLFFYCSMFCYCSICYSFVPALLLVCYWSVTALLLLCYCSVTALLLLCYCSATALLLLCYCSVTAL